MAETLHAAGKKVVLSTPAPIAAESELKTLRRLCDKGRFTVEANDLGTVRLLTDAGVSFVTEPTLNIVTATNPSFAPRACASQGGRS